MSKRVKIITPQNKTYRFDMVENQSSNHKLSLTRYPVQDGTPITDHAFKEPETINMSVSVSDIELSSYDNSFSDVNSRAEKALKIIKGWQDKVLLLTVQTKFLKYENMVLESISEASNNKNKNKLNASLTFRKIRIAKMEEIVVGPFETDDSATYESEYQNNGSSEGNVETSDILDVASDILNGDVEGALAGIIGFLAGEISGMIIPGSSTTAGTFTEGIVESAVVGSNEFLTETWKKFKGLF